MTSEQKEAHGPLKQKQWVILKSALNPAMQQSWLVSRALESYGLSLSAQTVNGDFQTESRVKIFAPVRGMVKMKFLWALMYSHSMFSLSSFECHCCAELKAEPVSCFTAVRRFFAKTCAFPFFRRQPQQIFSTKSSGRRDTLQFFCHKNSFSLDLGTYETESRPIQGW